MVGRDPALVGRDGELRQAVDVLGRPGSSLLLVGPPGAGRTRLAGELVAVVERRGGAAVWVSATRASSSLPLGALASLLPTDHEPVDRRSDVVERAVEAIAGANEGRVLVVDDAHHLDPLSAEVVAALVARPALHLVLTVRSGEGRPGPLVQVESDPAVVCIELAPLLPTDTEALAREQLGAPLDGASAAALYRVSAGNPLFASELLCGAGVDGTLVETGGVWRFTRPLRSSARLQDLVGDRLAGLGPGESEAFAFLAIAEDLDLEVLSELTTPEAAQGLVASGLARTASGRIQLDHPLHGEVGRSRISPLRWVTLHRRLADALDRAATEVSPNLLRRAIVRLEAGGAADPELLLAAARVARRDWDDDLAIRLARAARLAGAGAEAELLEAEALVQQGRVGEGEVVLARVIRSAATDRHRALAAIQLGIARFWGRQPDTDAALAAIDDADGVLADPGWRRELDAERAMIEAVGGRITAASSRLAGSAPPVGGGRAEVIVAAAACATRLWQGRLREAEQLAAAGVDLRFASDDTDGMIDGGFFFLIRNEAAMELGRLVEAADSLCLAYELTVLRRNAAAHAWTAVTAARAALATGRIAAAAGLAAEAAARFQETGNPRMRRLAVAVRASALLQLRDVGGASALVEALEAEAVEAGVFEAEVHRAAARLWFETGRPEDARTRLLAAASAAAEAGAATPALVLWHDAALLGAAKRASAALEAAGVAVDGPFAELRVRHCRALNGPVAGALDEISVAYESMGALLLAADASGAAAMAHRRSGRGGPAERADARARALVAACGAAPTPSMHEAGTTRLTQRQREVGRLVASGLTNREVAERLGLSVRTVENYVQSVFAELGVTSRLDLPDAW